MPIALPGDVVLLPPPSSSSSSSSSTTTTPPSIKLGPGLVHPQREPRTDKDGTTAVLATRAGVLGSVGVSLPSADGGGKGRAKGKGRGWWVEGRTKRYIPAASDPVLAQVTGKNADFYTLSLGSAHSATLPTLAFEGATKRHRPNLKVGSVVYGVVSSAEAWAEPEVTCVDPHTGKGNGMGELEVGSGSGSGRGEAEGTYCGVVAVSLSLAKSLLHPSHALLPCLATHFPFESAIGANGLVWLKVAQPAHFLAAKLVLEAADADADADADAGWSTRAVESSEDEDAGAEEGQEREAALSALLDCEAEAGGDAQGEWGRKLGTGWGWSTLASASASAAVKVKNGGKGARKQRTGAGAGAGAGVSEDDVRRIVREVVG